MAAVLGEETEQRVHGGRVVGAIDDEAAVLAALRQPGARRPGEMERERGRRQAQLLADRTGGKSLRTCLHQAPEDRKA